MKHEAKIDWWIGAAIAAGLMIPVVSAVLEGSYLGYGVSGAIWIAVFGFCVPQTYDTTADALVIRAGFLKRTIPLASITAIRPSQDSRSALALSLDRVRVEYAAGEVLIAPKDQAAFFADLASRAPQLSRIGQDLVVTLG